MSLPLHLRSYVEKTKDEANRDFFNVPPYEALAASGETQPNVVKQYAKAGDHQRDQLPVGMQPMEINAVLSVDGKDEVYVSFFLSFGWLWRVRWFLPVGTVQSWNAEGDIVSAPDESSLSGRPLF